MSQENNEKGNLGLVLYRIMLVCSVIVLGCVFLFGNCNIRKNAYKDINLYNDNWVCVSKDDAGIEHKENISLPHEFKDCKNVKIKSGLEKITGNLDDGEKCLAVHVVHKQLNVYIDGKRVTGFTTANGTSLSKTPGKAWIFIDIPKGSKEIELEIESVYDNNVDVEDIYVGGKKQVCLYLIASNAKGIVSSMIMIGMAGILLLLWFFIGMVNKERNNKLLYLAMFSGIISFWSFLECDSVQFLVKHQIILNMTSYELLLLMPIPIVCCVREDTKGVKRHILEVVIGISIINFIMCNAMQLSGKRDFAENTKFIHCVMVISAISVITLGTGKLFRRRMRIEKLTFNWDKMAYLILMFTTSLDIINYYVKWYMDAAKHSRVGLFFFILLLGISTIREMYRTTVLAERMELLEKYAHEDILTGAYNRVAFEDELQSIVKEQYDEMKVAIISFDVNNLKPINDTYGHSAGDEYLRECKNSMQDVIGEDNKIFRIGGDEFVAVIKSYKTGQVMKYIGDFETVLRNEKDTYKYPISFAYGYAYFKSKIDKDIYDTVKRADKDMYNKKIEMKKQAEYAVELLHSK